MVIEFSMAGVKSMCLSRISNRFYFIEYYDKEKCFIIINLTYICGLSKGSNISTFHCKDNSKP